MKFAHTVNPSSVASSTKARKISTVALNPSVTLRLQRNRHPGGVGLVYGFLLLISRLWVCAISMCEMRLTGTSASFLIYLAEQSIRLSIPLRAETWIRGESPDGNSERADGFVEPH